MLQGSFIHPALSLSLVAALTLFAVAVGGEVGRDSLSLGGPDEGELVRGVKLPRAGRGFLSNPGRTNADAEWGTEELVRALVTIGEDLDRWAPGATLVVNDLSLPEGGKIPHHQSHQAGRDVDLAFFSVDEQGKVLRSRAVRFDRDGRSSPGSTGSGSARFDTKRNWLVLKSLVLNDGAQLQRVFVAEHLRALLLESARADGEPAWLIERAGEAMCEPAVPHDDHFHVRLFCTPDDYRRGCRDSWPIYPWRRTAFAALGISSVEAAAPTASSKTRRRRPARPRKTIGRVWCP